MTSRLSSPRSAGVILAALLLSLGAAAPQPAAQKSRDDPTLVTLHYTNAPADVVLKDLFDQMGAGYTRSNAAGDWPTISLDADKQPYWNVVTLLENKSNLTFSTSTTARTTVINFHSPNTPNPLAGPSCICGPYMITIRQLVNSVTLTDASGAPNCHLEILLRAEPQMHIALYTSRTEPDLAVDENRHSLLGIAPATVSISSGGFAQPQLEIPLQPPPTAGHKIAQLKGAIHVSVFDKIQALDIPATDFGQTREFGLMGAILEISPITSPNAGTTDPETRISLRLTRNGLSDDDWKKAIDLLDAVDMQVLDADNNSYTQSGSGGGSGSNDRLRTVGFRPASNTPARTPMGPAAKCRIIVPQTLRDVPLNYEFRDLPLP